MRYACLLVSLLIFGSSLPAAPSTDEELEIAFRELVSELKAVKAANVEGLAANRSGQVALAVVKEQARVQAEDAETNRQAAAAEKKLREVETKDKLWWREAAFVGWGIILSVVGFLLIRAWYKGTLKTAIASFRGGI